MRDESRCQEQALFKGGFARGTRGPRARDILVNKLLPGSGLKAGTGLGQRSRDGRCPDVAPARAHDRQGRRGHSRTLSTFADVKNELETHGSHGKSQPPPGLAEPYLPRSLSPPLAVPHAGRVQVVRDKAPNLSASFPACKRGRRLSPRAVIPTSYSIFGTLQRELGTLFFQQLFCVHRNNKHEWMSLSRQDHKVLETRNLRLPLCPQSQRAARGVMGTSTWLWWPSPATADLLLRVRELQ